MTEAVAHIIQSMNNLSEDERAEIAYAYVCSLEPETDAGAGEAWKQELSQRVDEIRRGDVVGKPADQLFRELRENQP